MRTMRQGLHACHWRWRVLLRMLVDKLLCLWLLGSGLAESIGPRVLAVPPLCVCLSSSYQGHFRDMADALKASFIPWDSSWRHDTLEEVRAAKATLAVPQPAKVADWLYVGDIHDVQLLVAGGPSALKFAGILSLCPENMQKISGTDRYGHLQGVGCAHQIVAAVDSMAFNMLSEALPAAIRFVKPFSSAGSRCWFTATAASTDLFS